jgi:hypothetical protein
MVALLVAGLPISWVAMNYYQRWRVHSDFAEDTVGNPVPDRDISNE